MDCNDWLFEKPAITRIITSWHSQNCEPFNLLETAALPFKYVTSVRTYQFYRACKSRELETLEQSSILIMLQKRFCLNEEHKAKVQHQHKSTSLETSDVYVKVPESCNVDYKIYKLMTEYVITSVP
jgi:hypothetical protein